MISVWPPTRVTPRSAHARPSWSKASSTSSGCVPSGKRRVAISHLGRRSNDGEVVGVDLDDVPADEVCGEGDGVGLGGEVAVAEVDQGGVLAGPGTDDDAGVVLGYSGEQLREQVERQLPGFHVERAASGVMSRRLCGHIRGIRTLRCVRHLVPFGDI